MKNARSGDGIDDLSREQHADDEPAPRGEVSAKVRILSGVVRDIYRGGEVIESGEQDRRPQVAEVERDALRHLEGVDPGGDDEDEGEERDQRRLRLELLQRVGADHAGEAAEQLGDGELEDQAIEGEEEAELVQSGPPPQPFCRNVSEEEVPGKRTG